MAYEFETYHDILKFIKSNFEIQKKKQVGAHIQLKLRYRLICIILELWKSGRKDVKHTYTVIQT